MAWQDVVHLDRMVLLEGVYAAGDTTWTLPFDDDSLDCIVLGPDFGDSTGSILTPDSNADGVVTLAGDYDAGEVAIGRLYPMTVELSREYVRDFNGMPYISNKTTYRELAVMVHKTGALTLRRVMEGRSDATVVLDEDPIVDRRRLLARFNGDADQMRVYIENHTAKPCTVVALQYLVNHRAQ